MMVWKGRTVLRAYGIYTAFIVYQKGAWLRLIDYIAGVFFFSQIRFKKQRRRHIKVGGNPFDITAGVGGRHGLAAVGAGCTIGFTPHAGIFFRHYARKTGRYNII